MTNLQTKYQQALPTLKQQFGFKNDLAAPILAKIVINVGIAEAKENKDVLEKVRDQLGQISGQRPKITKAKKAISSFKLKKNDPIGAMTTLRGKRAWYLLEKLATVVLPRMRDFRGLQPEKFDKMGNYSLGLEEQVLFPEIDFAKADKTRGMVITIVIKNSDIEKSQKLFELLGLPFKK